MADAAKALFNNGKTETKAHKGGLLPVAGLPLRSPKGAGRSPAIQGSSPMRQASPRHAR